MEIVDNKNKYNAGTDFIKIISMLFIVISHALSYSNCTDGVIKTAIMSSSIIADNLFVLVTGYLGTNNPHKEIKKKKIFKLIVKADIYSWIIFGVLFFFGYTKLTAETRYDIFPVLMGGYWFILIYILLYLLKPFLDSYMTNCTKEQLKKTIYILLFICSIVPSIPYSLEAGAYHGYSVLWFVSLYFVGNYLCRCGFVFVKISMLLRVGLFILIFIFKVVISCINPPYEGILGNVNNLNNFLWFIESILIFEILIQLKDRLYRYSSILKFFASASLGVFLLHMQPSLKKVLWIKFSDIATTIAAAVVVYFICVLADKIFSQTLDFIEKKLKIL